MGLPKPNKIVGINYIAGLSSFKRKLVKIKLSANESALGPSPRAIKEYNKISKNFKRYPDTNGNSLKNVIAKKQWKHISFNHVYRKHNKRADQLANEALDEL